MIYLDKSQVRDMVKEAEDEGVSISIRCIRKGKGDVRLGTTQGELHTLICGRKPLYEATSTRDRAEEDNSKDVLTVWALNRRTGDKDGAWRRINLAAVQEVRFRETEYKVVVS